MLFMLNNKNQWKFKYILLFFFEIKIKMIKMNKAHKANAEEYLDGIERTTTHTVNLNKDINQLLIERDNLLVKLNEGSFKYHVFYELFP